jgi:hypothetical protein
MDLFNLANQFAKAATFRAPHKPDIGTVNRMTAAVDAFLKDNGIPGADYVVCAGSAMVVHGLKDNFNDIDLYVPDLPETHVEGMYGGMEVDGHNEWELAPGFSDEIMSDRVNINGLWTMSVPSILKFKQIMNRDQLDIETLERYLGP